MSTRLKLGRFPDTLEQVTPAFQGLATGEMSIQHGARASPHLISFSAVRGQSKDQVDQGIGISRRDDVAALVLLDQSCDLAVVVADGDHGPAGGGNAIDLARNNEAFDLGQERNPMDIRNA